MLISLLTRTLEFRARRARWKRTLTHERTRRLGAKPRIKRADEDLRGVHGKYALATGEAAAHRLGILQEVYGVGTRRLLKQAGLQRGMRVADIGCGIGTMTMLCAELVGSSGSVVGVDLSRDQLTQACKRLSPDQHNVGFVEASATQTLLPQASFDLVYCRFLLLHLPEPQRALAEMQRLLKPGGVLVCEDGDLTSAASEPPSALGDFADLFGKLGSARGLDYTLGKRLFHMVQAAGFQAPAIAFNQPVMARGQAKRLLELSLAEAAPALIEAGIISAVELESKLIEMRRLADDENVLAIMPRMAQVWARK